MFDMKTQYKLFAQVLGVQLAGPWQDPKIAAWLIDPGASEANLHRLVHNCIPLETHLLEGDVEPLHTFFSLADHPLLTCLIIVWRSCRRSPVVAKIFEKRLK